MAFVLPASKYTTVEQAPTPTDPRVTLRQLPERVQVQVSKVHGADALIAAHRAVSELGEPASAVQQRARRGA